MRYYVQEDGEWFEPRGNYKQSCCDCGLVHAMQFRVNKNGRIEFRAFRDRRATAAKRRHMKAVIHWVRPEDK
jgi:hypothetical protein